MKHAVVFYSNDGNTAAAARAIAGILQADVFSLQEKKARRTDMRGFIRSGFQAALKMCSRLVRDYAGETRPYDSLYIGSPVWAGHATPAVNAYVKKADFSGKDVTLFFLCASPEADYRPKGIDHLCAMIRKKGGTIKHVHVWRGGAPGKPADALAIASQVEEALKEKP